MSKKELLNGAKNFTKNYAIGYNMALDMTLLVAGIKLRNKKLIATAAIATAGTIGMFYDESIKPLIEEFKNERETE